MNRRTQVPSIPDPTPDGLVDLARSIKNILDVREGRAGDKQDRFVSFRDLEDMNIITDAKTKSGDPSNNGGNPKPPDGYNPEEDYTTPPIPTGFRVRGGYGVIMLSWDTPQALYRNHAYTEIWRNTVDSIGTAVLIGTTIASVYSDPVPESTTYYYWIRFVSQANVTGPYNGTSGTQATSAIDVERVIDALSGQITSSQLYGDLRSRIDLIDADPTVEGSVAWRVAQQAEETDAAITEVRQIVANANQSLVQQSSLMTASFNNAYGAIADEATVRATQDGVLANQINAVSATASARNRVFFQTSSPTASATGDLWFDTDDNNAMYRWSGSAWVREAVAANVYRQTTAPTNTSANPLREGDMWLDSDDQNRPYRWNGSSWVDVRDGFISTVDARVTTVENTKIGYCTIGGVANDYTTRATCEAAGGTWNVGLPIATAVKQVSVSDGEGSLSLEQRFTAQRGTNNQLLGQYTVKIDNNGAVSGFGLASTAVNGVPLSEFYVNANRFAITAPANSTGTSFPSVGLYTGYIFYLTTDKTHWRWTGTKWESFAPKVPFVVQTTTTNINGKSVPPGVYIDSAYIANGTITSATIGVGTITEANITDATITTAKIADGTITTAKIAEVIQSSNWSQGFGLGWQINKSGTATFNQVNVRGTVYATAGSFGNPSGSRIIVGDYSAGGTGIYSSNYSAGSAGFRIGYDGAAEFNNVTVRGAVYASSGSFTGAITATSGSFTGSLNAASGTFSGTLTADAINAVNTINIAGNAVTIPSVAQQTSSVYVGGYAGSAREYWFGNSDEIWYPDGNGNPQTHVPELDWNSESLTYWTPVNSIDIFYTNLGGTQPSTILGFTQRSESPGGSEWGIRWRLIRITPVVQDQYGTFLQFQGYLNYIPNWYGSYGDWYSVNGYYVYWNGYQWKNAFTVIGKGASGNFNNNVASSFISGIGFDAYPPTQANGTPKSVYKLCVGLFGNINNGISFRNGLLYTLGAKR